MYEKIFEDIVDIIHHDYAGCKDKKNWDHPEEFKAQIHNDLTPQEFTDLVKDYLTDLKDSH